MIDGLKLSLFILNKSLSLKNQPSELFFH